MTYSTHGCHNSRRSREYRSRSENTPESENLMQRLNAFVQRSSSLKRLEPSYRQIYPSKKPKTTFKIPKRPPYIPAINQKKIKSFSGKYKSVNLQSVRGSRQQWPPLYPRKRKDNLQTKQSKNKTHDLPPWLLPLYSCKACHNKDESFIHEARFSGGAFRRKMEIMESIKQIRANQNFIRPHEKDNTKDETARLEPEKLSKAVEALKQKIYGMKKKKAGHCKYQLQRMAHESEAVKKPIPVGLAYTRIYQTKLPTRETELDARNSMDSSVTGPKSSGKPLTSLSNITELTLENVKQVDNQTNHSPRKVSTGQNQDIESSNQKQTIISKLATAEATKNVSQTNDYNFKNWTSARRPLREGDIVNDSSTHRLSNVKKVKEAETVDVWTVESLKSRISFMKIKSTPDEQNLKLKEDVSHTRNGGEADPKLSQVAFRTFHKADGRKNPHKVLITGATKVRLGHQRAISRRDYSTFWPPPNHPVTRALGCLRRTPIVTPQNKSKKRNWANRLKKFFVLKKIKCKCRNWKETPREIPYEEAEVKCYSPAPILWKAAALNDNPRRPRSAEVCEEKVNPVVLNAEHRVLASISRLSTNTHPETPQVWVMDMEKRMRRIQMEVNMPWLKKKNNTDSIEKLPQVRDSHNKPESKEPQESGYGWILKNRDIVEELKRHSLCTESKSLVPMEVKNAITQYKLPLKAEISQYRKKMDRKYSENYHLYSMSRRWYSTCFSVTHKRILAHSDVLVLSTRGIKTFEANSKLLDRGARSNIELETNVKQRRFNQSLVGRPKEQWSKLEEPYLDGEKHAIRWGWKIPQKTRAFTPAITNQSSLSKPIHSRMSEMSSSALKKQVEELKRLIKKAKEDVGEKTDNSPIDPQSENDYETRLKRLVKVAHNNAKKMQIAAPKFTSENTMMADKPTKEINSNGESAGSKCEADLSKRQSLFKTPNREQTSQDDDIISPNNLTSLPPPSSAKPISKAYLKLKSMVESARMKSSTLDSVEVPHLSSNSCTGNSSMDGAASAKSRDKIGKHRNAGKSENLDQNTVELLAQRTPSPSNTIQLWKGESKPINLSKSTEPTYGDLFSLFTRAKGLFYLEEGKNSLMESDPSRSLLSIRQNVSSKVSAMSEQNDSEKVTSHASTLGEKQDIVGIDSECMMTKSTMIPFEIFQPGTKPSNAPAKIVQNEYIGTSSSGTCMSENQLINQVPPSIRKDVSNCANDKLTIHSNAFHPRIDSNQQEVETPVEGKKRLLQMPIITWESITKNFGGNLFGKGTVNPNNAGDIAEEHGKRQGELQNYQGEATSPKDITMSNFTANDTHTHSPEDKCVGDCVEGVKSMEEAVIKYDDYYRKYFTEDIVNGYGNLQQVYDGLHELNTLQHWGTMGNKPEDEIHNKKVNTMNYESKTEIPLDGNELVMKIVETANNGTLKTSVSSVTLSEIVGSKNATIKDNVLNNPAERDEIGHQGANDRRDSEAVSSTTNQITDPSCYMNEYLQMQNAEETVQQLNKVYATNLDVNPNNELNNNPPDISCGNGPSESEKLEDLLTQDPSLNPEVVRRLKLPVMLSESSTEKNWYTNLLGPHKNR